MLTPQACDLEVASTQLRAIVARLRREQRAQFRPSGAQHINPPQSSGAPGSNLGNGDDPPESAWERKAARAILRLEEQFPGDVGAMAPLFLNYLLIAPGESFFMAANEPHAYVAGEILECMACSDNVVRAGLTPKLKDVDNLVEMLTYLIAARTGTSAAPPRPRIIPRRRAFAATTRGRSAENETRASGTPWAAPTSSSGAWSTRARARGRCATRRPRRGRAAIFREMDAVASPPP